MEKKYGLFTAVCMVVGIVIGSGIFFKTEAVLAATGGDVFSGVLSLLIMGAVLFFCAYAFSLLAQKQEGGGLLDYAESACGEMYAYYLGWFMAVIYTPAITSVLAWASARYLCALFGFGPASGETMAAAALFLTTDAFLNATAPRLAGGAQISSTLIKLIPLTAVSAAGIFSGLSGGGTTEIFQLPSPETASAAGGVIASVVSLSFAFEGWILVTSIAGELKEPQKNMPRALTLGAAGIAAIYIAYYLGLCAIAPVEELLSFGSAQILITAFGRSAGTLLSVFVVISCMGSAHGMMMANTRSIYSLAVRGRGPAPKLFARVDENTNMPMNSAFLGTLLAMVWLVYFFGANLSTGWFGVFSFDSGELPIVTLYAFYIPIFFRMYSDRALPPVKRVVVPTLAICSCLLLMSGAVYAHGFVPYAASAAEGGRFAFPVLFYLVVFAAIMLAGAGFSKRRK